MKLYQIAWLNIQRNRQRSLLAATAMLVVSAVLVFGFSILEGMKVEMVYNVHTFTFGEVKINNPEFEKNQILNPMHLNIPDGAATVAWAESQPETAHAVPRITFGGLIERNDKRYQAQGWGVDFVREEGNSGLSKLLKSGRLPATGEREAVLGLGLARNLGLKVGDKFSVMSITRNRSMNKITLTVVGILDIPVASLSSLVFMTSLEKAQSFLQMDKAIIEVLVKTKPGTDLNALSARWSAQLKDQNLKVANWTQTSFIYTMVQFVDIVYNFIGIMFILLGSAVIINTTMMVVFERRVEIGTMGALGMHGSELIRLFLLESLFLAAIGALIGSLIGAALSAWLGVVGIDFSALMKDINLEFPTVLHPVLNVRSVLGSLAMTMVLSGLASLLPSWMAARIQPVEALRN